ncbi:hypothetical protein [Streptomyces sp. NBC_01589]|uniref:hypothetical protein n=1 Tax=unclassified Streptomyces TaxID=2593676 RepID=UPI003868A1BB
MVGDERRQAGSELGFSSLKEAPNARRSSSLAGTVRRINSWNENAKPFTLAATADEILAKVRRVQTSVKKLVNRNSK